MDTWILIFFICFPGAECNPISEQVTSKQECQKLARHLTKLYPNYLGYLQEANPQCIRLKHDTIQKQSH